MGILGEDPQLGGILGNGAVQAMQNGGLPQYLAQGAAQAAPVPSRRQKWANALSIIGATLRDVGTGGEANALSTLQAQRAKAAAQQQLMAALGQPGAGGGASGGLPPLRAVAPALIAAANGGIDISPYVTLLNDTQPQITNINGFGVDSRDPNSVGKYFPSLDKEQEPVYDGNGRVVGVRNMDGSLQAAADTARATEGAKSEAQAAYDIVQVPMPDGSMQSMTRLQAAQLFSGQGPAAPASGSGPAVAAPAMPIGRSQTPADKVLAEGNAKTQVDRNAAQPQQWSGLTDQARTTDLVLNYIDQALKQIDRLSAGPMALTAALPGTPAYNLRATIDTIKANVGFDKLQQMRNNSPTGGALGQVSEQENRLLQSVLGSIDQGQSAEQLRNNLMTIRDQLSAVAEQRQQVYDKMYGSQPEPGRPSAADIEAELRRRGLLK